MARRAWVIDTLRRTFEGAPLLLVDSGNFTGSPSERGDAQTRTLVEAMQRLSYGVVNVGERDVRQGYDALRKLVDGTSFELVSANLLRLDDQQPVFRPHVVVQLARPEGAPLRVGVTGAMRFNPIFRKPGPEGTDMFIAHPVEAVKHEVQALRAEGVDLVVLLAAMHKDDVHRLLEAVPGIDAVAGAFGGASTNPDERSGTTSIVYCGDRGQQLGETRVFFDGATGSPILQTHAYHLTAQVPSEQVMLDFVNAMHASAESEPRKDAAAKM